MQPDRAGFRPSERLGQKAETLREPAAVGTIQPEPRGEVEEDKRERYELEKTIEEKVARDA